MCGWGEGERRKGRVRWGVGRRKEGVVRESDKKNVQLRHLTCYRCHESVDRGLLKSLLRMLVDLQVYQEVFELKFLHETETTYRAEALRMMRDPEFTVSQ